MFYFILQFAAIKYEAVAVWVVPVHTAALTASYKHILH